MERRVLEKLVLFVQISLKHSEDMGRRSGRKAIASDVRLGITLLLLAGGSYLDLMEAYRTGRSTVYDIFHSICEALMKTLKLPGLPSTLDDLKTSETAFKTSRSPPNPLSGCVGALDGIYVKIQKPPNELNPAAFFSVGRATILFLYKH